ncbi:hypothetical protein AAFF_G00362580 [Aldrovandia affinis]|uniref:Uncharacterized protein n=1 Tax=Aldrovandia affinis TaxID=143900 RepID=A0AAD7WNW8_9TELE|nr:hypothetical protein AAFF_G00362580 [Aldrovandia affinis]
MAGSSNDRGRDRETEEDDSLYSMREDEVEAEQPEVQSGESQQEPKEELETWVFTITNPAFRSSCTSL